ncbi:MAG: 50S ribosomal protein L20 [Candidatus Melainabacteria bacterium]
MRVKRGNVSRQRHKKLLKLAKGFRGSRSKIFRVASQAVQKALKHAYRDRRNKRRSLRRLWITRINAAARIHGLSYSRLMNGLAKAGIPVNRKFLADVAVKDAVAFKAIADKAQAALA